MHRVSRFPLKLTVPEPAAPRSGIPFRCWACLAVVLLAGSGFALEAHARSDGIHVTGAGEVRVVPDMAQVALEVRREGNDAAALKTELDRVTAAVIALTRSLRIDAKDVTAAAVTIQPRYRHRDGETVVDGVVAVRSIEVTLRQLDRIGELVNGALERGVNGIRGVTLDASNRAELEDRALDRAIDDAVRVAGRVAERFGVPLGTLVATETSPHTVVPVAMDAMAVRMAPESFEPGTLTIRREVRATFAIGQGSG
jgi:uncharacterized protein